MKKALLLIFLLLISGLESLKAAETVAGFEREVKDLLARVSPSLLRVVAENSKRYVATGIAVEADLVVSTTQLLQHPDMSFQVETVRGDAYPARLVGHDRPSGVILLRLERRALPPMPVASGCETGHWAALVGAFYDRFPAITQGLVSSVGDGDLLLNAPVIPGSPGGAVVNRQGQMVGIIRGAFGVARLPDYSYTDQTAEIVLRGRRDRDQNLCYALTAAKVLDLVADLKKYGRVRRAWMGVSFDTTASRRIAEVNRSSPAAAAGLRPGDEIVAVNGRKLSDITVLGRMVQEGEPHQELRLEILRDRQPRLVSVRLAEQPASAEPAAVALPGAPPPFEGGGFPMAPGSLPEIENFVFNFSGSRQLGIETLDLTAELARKLQVPADGGLLIARVAAAGVSRRAGLEAGDVIVRVAGSPVRRLADLRQALAGLNRGAPALLELYRDGRQRKFSIVPESLPEPGPDQSWEVLFGDRMRAVSEFMKRSWLEANPDGSPMRPDPERPGPPPGTNRHLEEIRSLQGGAAGTKADVDSQRRLERDVKKAQLELRRIDMAKERLGEDRRRQVTERLRRLQEELRLIQEMLQQGPPSADDPGPS